LQRGNYGIVKQHLVRCLLNPGQAASMGRSSTGLAV